MRLPAAAGRRALAAALRDAEALADWCAWRADRRATFLVIMRALIWRANPETLRTHPTLAYLVNATGRCSAARGGGTCTCGLTRRGRTVPCTRTKRIVQMRLRDAEEAGLLDVLEPGTTPRFRPHVLHAGDPNLAREWRIVPPPAARLVDVNFTPPGLIFTCEKNPSAGVREKTQHHHQIGRRSAPDSSPGCLSPVPANPDRSRQTTAKSLPSTAHRRPAGQPTWPLTQTPQRQAAALAACDSLRAASPVLRRISAKALRSALREWFAAGHSPDSILDKLDRRPDETAWTYEHDVRVPAAWLAWRLSAWRGPDGKPLPPRASELGERAEREREAQAAERARIAEHVRPAGDPRVAAGHLAAARAKAEAGRRRGRQRSSQHRDPAEDGRR